MHKPEGIEHHTSNCDSVHSAWSEIDDMLSGAMHRLAAADELVASNSATLKQFEKKEAKTEG